jgi:phosphoribosylamine--glycine ligase
VSEKIIKPTLAGLKKEGRKFSGCLYTGLMITPEGPKVVEFNCRFGDPETQAVLPVISGDFLKLLYSSASGKIDKKAVTYSGGAAICVVAVSSGYPDKYPKGFEINGLSDFPPYIIIFHAGTKEQDGKVVTSGGRVLGVTAFLSENDLQKARTLAYGALQNIHFEGMYYRRDIGMKAFRQDKR